MKIGAIIEARMNSTRLPGKVLLEAAGKTMLSHLVDRIKVVNKIKNIIIATTKNKKDDQLEEFAFNNKLECYRGSEEDVMQRVIDSALKFNIDTIVEITGDCPIIDPNIIDQCLEIYLNNDADYVTNCHIRSYPDGMDVQVYNLKTLEKSSKMTKNKLDREHVTLHIRNNPQIFRSINLLPSKEMFWPELGLTLDENKDYILLKKIIEYFDNKKAFFNCRDVIELLKKKKNWIKINNSVKRKKIS